MGEYGSMLTSRSLVGVTVVWKKQEYEVGEWESVFPNMNRQTGVDVGKEESG